MRLLVLLLSACVELPPDTGPVTPEPVDPEVLLVGLANAHADELFLGIQSGVEAQSGSLYDMDPGDVREGALEVAGSMDVGGEWAVTYREDDELRIWDWAFDITSERLTLDSADVAGTAAWTVEDVVWDLHYANHTWSGALSIDGEPPVPVAWAAYFSGNLHAVEGTVDGEAVTWENEDPDLP